MKIIKSTKTIALLFLVSIALFSCNSKDDGDPVNPTDPVNPVDPPTIKVKSVSLNKTAIIKTVGETEQLTATVKPSDATNKGVTWKSSNNEVASVDAEGKLTAKKVGITVISVSTKDGNKSDKCTVTVKAAIPYIRMQTTKDRVSFWIDAAEADRPDCWIDLNNDSIRGDEDIAFGQNKTYNLADQVITIYGKVNIISCRDDKLIKLDVSNNSKLQYIDCSENQLTKLDLSKNMELDTINCRLNKLTELDLSKNKNLREIYCSGNKLTELDLSNNKKATYISCGRNQLTKLDLSNNLELIILYCDRSKLTELDLSNNKKLERAYCYNNQLTKLDLSNNKKLQAINCKGNQSLINLNLANGKNASVLQSVIATDCPNLSCIQIDKGFTPNKNWHKDLAAKWNNNGNPCQ